MRLLRIILCTALIAGSAVAINAAPASATPAACQSLTVKYQSLLAPANSINIINAPLIIIGQGPLPAIVAGLNSISTELSADVASNVLCLPSDTGDFNTLSTVSGQLFNILIGKTGLLGNLEALLTPLRQTYITLESTMDDWLIAAGVTDTYIPSQQLNTLISATSGF